MDEEYLKYITEEWLKTLQKIVKDKLGEMQFFKLM